MIVIRHPEVCSARTFASRHKVAARAFLLLGCRRHTRQGRVDCDCCCSNPHCYNVPVTILSLNPGPMSGSSPAEADQPTRRISIVCIRQADRRPEIQSFRTGHVPDSGLFLLFPPVTLPVTSHDLVEWDDIHSSIDSQHANLLFTSVEQQEMALHIRP